jgi:peroxiredoxin
MAYQLPYKLKIGDAAPDFSLTGTDSRTYTLKYFKKDMLVIMFTCNHCPYVKAYESRMIALQEEFKGDTQFVAINSNDDENYPEDSYENMIKRAKEKGYNFPYLRDDAQDVAKEYGAQTTPHTFLFDKERRLRYQGRMDDNWENPGAVREHYLKDAIAALRDNKRIVKKETPVIGCSVKWK